MLWCVIHVRPSIFTKNKALAFLSKIFSPYDYTIKKQYKWMSSLILTSISLLSSVLNSRIPSPFLLNFYSIIQQVLNLYPCCYRKDFTFRNLTLFYCCRKYFLILSHEKESYCPLKVIFLHKNKESHFHRASYRLGHWQKHSWLREHTLAWCDRSCRRSDGCKSQTG